MNKMKKCWLVTFVVAFGFFAQGALAQERNQEFPRDVHGLWWQPADPGWATTVFDHETAMSSALLLYDHEGRPIWFFSPRLDCARETPRDILVGCFGAMYRVTGPWFGEPTFRPDLVRAEAVGEWSGGWAAPLFGGVGPDSRRTLYILYTINGTTIRMGGGTPMLVQVIDRDAPLLYLDTSHSGLWGNPNERGWGVGLFQQGNKLTATLFIHGRDGQPRWYVVNATAPEFFDVTVGPPFNRLFEGEVFETRGHPWGVVTTEQYSARRVGSASLRYGATAADGASLRYSIDGVEVSKTIFRLR